MVNVAVQAGVLSGSDFDPDPGEPPVEVWSGLAAAADLPERELAILVADYFRLEVADLDRAEPSAVLDVAADLATRYLVFPLERSDRTLVVATADPTNVEAERALGFTSGRAISFRVAPPGDIAQAIQQRYQETGGMEEHYLGESAEVDLVQVLEEPEEDGLSIEDIHAAPVVKLTNLIIRDGIQQGASDIHIEPGAGAGKVRYRVDGVLRKHMDVPMSAMQRIISQIKVRSDMDIADRLRPQDGRTRVSVDENVYDLRISTIPAGRAEKCVIRILDQNESKTLDDLAIRAGELSRFRSLLGHREGIVVVTGPTGSGKTTTLYGALREIADGRVNIMTVEDPIEYSLEAVTQTQVEVKQGMTFGSALRAILRQDPDVILVGEIRDAETAKIASQAAMTGHLVLATVHANDAVGVVPRLIDLGLDHATVASTLKGAVAQRLLRRLCPRCSETIDGDLSPEESTLFQRYDVRPTVRANGCSHCGFTGFRGRLPILEVLTVSSRVEEAIDRKKGGATLQALAVRAGMRTLEEGALEWVKEGATTLMEVDRVVGSARDALEQEREQPAGRARILIVDDEEADRVLHRAVLEEHGYEVVEAADGEEGLQILAKDGSFSLVLLDLKLGDLSGLKVLRRIRDSVHTHALPVMISTGDDTETTETELLEAGADDYLEKSARPGRFIARVRAVLRRAAM